MTNAFDTLARTHLTPDHRSHPGFERFLIRYMFGLESSQEVARRIRSVYDLPNRAAVDFRMALNASGYLMQHVKPYLFWCYKHGLDRGEDATNIGLLFGVHVVDLPLVRHLWHESMTDMSSLDQYASLSPAVYRRQYVSIFKELVPHASSFVWRKHRFIFRQSANGETQEDILNEVLAKGMQGFAVKYPRMESRLHALNIGKTSLHNMGMNVISYHTSKGRSNLTATAEGYQATCTSVLDDSDAMAVTDQALAMVETNATVRMLLDRFGGRKRGALTAMMGLPNRSFTRWLQSNAYVRHRMPNDELLDLLSDRDQYGKYEDYIMRWLGINRSQLIGLKSELQDALA